MKCLREMNDRKESLKIKIKNRNAYFPRGRDIQHIASWGKMYC